MRDRFNRASALFVLATLAGCNWLPWVGPPDANIQAILGLTEATLQMLERSKTESEQTVEKIDDAYLELRAYLHEKELTPANVQRMEETYDGMTEQSKTLHKTLRQTANQAGELFAMLEKRARENSNKDLRRALLDDIKAKRKALEARLEVAEDGLDKMDRSIQTYDDLLGFAQVSLGTAAVDEHIATVEGVLEEAERLNAEIQVAINEGVEIVNGLQGGGEPAE